MCVFCEKGAIIGSGRNDLMFIHEPNYSFRLGRILDLYLENVEQSEREFVLPCIRFENGDLAVNSFPIQYCPMCGKQLVKMNESDMELPWTLEFKKGEKNNE